MEQTNKPRKLVVEGGKPIIDFDHKQYKPAPQEGIKVAVKLMEAGMMYRYQPDSKETSQTSLLEKEFGDRFGFKYVTGVNSCGSSIFIALKIAGVKPGDKVLSNAFTFTAVPSAINHACAEPVLVETNDEWALNFEDLEKKIESSGAKVLLMSYMRGHIPNMDKLMEVIEKHDIFFIEDCAHALTCTWRGQMGTFGKIACFSTQSSKCLSSGEGGLFATNIEEYGIKSLLYAGSYEHRWQNHWNYDPEECKKWVKLIPGYSLRMQEITAAILRPQIERAFKNRKIHRENYQLLTRIISTSDHIRVPKPLEHASYYNDTMQFHFVGLTKEQAHEFIKVSKKEKISAQIFGEPNNSRNYKYWQYMNVQQDCPETDKNIEFAVDISLQPHLTQENIKVFGQVLLEVVDYVTRK